jgi:hypothetical protein
MTPVPRLHFTLEDLAREPARVGEVPRERIAALMAQTAALQAGLAARALELEGPREPAEPASPTPSAEEFLTVQEAAELLHVRPRWLYDHASEIPGIERLSKKTLRIPRKGLEKYLSRKRLDGSTVSRYHARHEAKS